MKLFMELQRKRMYKGQYYVYRSLAVFGAITSKGDWFFSNLIRHNNSVEFIIFIKELMNWLLEDLKVSSHYIVLIIDNSPIHTSAYSMKNLKDLNCKVVFLSPYWPNFAPIELMFHILKKRIWRHSRIESIRLYSNNGPRALKEVLATFTNIQILGFWIKVMRNINDELGQISK